MQSMQSDMFIGPFLFFFSGLAGIQQQAGSTGWRKLRIAPQAFNYWSFPNGASRFFPAAVNVLAAEWGGNCQNRSSVLDLTAAVQKQCVGKSECRFTIPNTTDCWDPPPPPPLPPPAPPPAPQSAMCSKGSCHMLPLPNSRFFAGSWHELRVNVTTNAECIQACFEDSTCEQTTWLVRPGSECSLYRQIAGGWPPSNRIAGVRANVKCFANETDPKQCNQKAPLPPPPPPPRPIQRKVMNVSFSCGTNQPARVLTLGPDKGTHVGDGDGISFTEAGGREIHIDCKPRAAELDFVTAEVMTYQGRVSSRWRVLNVASDASSTQKFAGSTVCDTVDVNTYTAAPAAFGDRASPAAVEMRCTSGVIADVTFASFGRPTGTCGNLSINPSCHHPKSMEVVRQLCVGKPRCSIQAGLHQFGESDPCPRNGLTLNTGPQRLAVSVQGCKSAELFELNVTIPIGSEAEVEFPTRLLGVDPGAATTSISDGEGRHIPTSVDTATGDMVATVSSGSHRFVLSAMQTV